MVRSVTAGLSRGGLLKPFIICRIFGNVAALKVGKSPDVFSICSNAGRNSGLTSAIESAREARVAVAGLAAI